jgi:hypothetical protein
MSRLKNIRPDETIKINQTKDDLGYLGTKEALKIAGITLPTLLKMGKKGYIKMKPMKVPGKTRPGKYLFEKQSLIDFSKNKIDLRKRGEITKFSQLTIKEKWIYTHLWRRNEIGATLSSLASGVGVSRQAIFVKVKKMKEMGLVKSIDSRYFVGKILEID